MKLKSRAVAVTLAVTALALVAAVAFTLGALGSFAPIASVEQSVAPAGGVVGYEQTDESLYGADLGAPETARSSAGAPAEDGASKDAMSASQQMIIRTAAMELRVDDVEQAVKELRTRAARHEAEVSDLSILTGEPPVGLIGRGAEAVAGPATAYVTLRVPAAKLDRLQDDIAGLGTLISASSNSNDVTEQAIDLEARLGNLRAEEARLRELLARTNKVSELLEVERELSRVRGDIESMDAQLTYLKRQAARSTLTVTLTEPGPIAQPVGATWGLREAVTRGIQAAATLVATLITLAFPLAVIALIAGVIGLVVRQLMRRHSRRRAAMSAADDSVPEPPA